MYRYYKAQITSDTWLSQYWCGSFVVPTLLCKRSTMLVAVISRTNCMPFEQLRGIEVKWGSQNPWLISQNKVPLVSPTGTQIHTYTHILYLDLNPTILPLTWFKHQNRVFKLSETDFGSSKDQYNQRSSWFKKWRQSFQKTLCYIEEWIKAFVSIDKNIRHRWSSPCCQKGQSWFTEC